MKNKKIKAKKYYQPDKYELQKRPQEYYSNLSGDGKNKKNEPTLILERKIC